MNTPNHIEWPTLLLAVVIYGAWGALTFFGAALPLWLLLPAGAWVTAWHMSLQHETLHGHPTPWRRVNDAIGFVPLSPWLPYARYRDEHLRHHSSPEITDPVDDPESWYVAQAPAALARRVLVFRNTLAGRVLLGPALGIAGFLLAEARAAAHDPSIRRAWAVHLLGAALVVAWLVLACHMSLLLFAAGFVYPGYALSLVRSFAEHRAAAAREHRTAIVERAPLLGMLFLFNNLHAVHHGYPGLPWYRIPAVYRRERRRLIVANGGLVYRGYLDVARRFLFRPHDVLEHPFPKGS